MGTGGVRSYARVKTANVSKALCRCGALNRCQVSQTSVHKSVYLGVYDGLPLIFHTWRYSGVIWHCPTVQNIFLLQVGMDKRRCKPTEIPSCCFRDNIQVVYCKTRCVTLLYYVLIQSHRLCLSVYGRAWAASCRPWPGQKRSYESLIARSMIVLSRSQCR